MATGPRPSAHSHRFRLTTATRIEPLPTYAAYCHVPLHYTVDHLLGKLSGILRFLTESVHGTMNEYLATYEFLSVALMLDNRHQTNRVILTDSTAEFLFENFWYIDAKRMEDEGLSEAGKTTKLWKDRAIDKLLWDAGEKRFQKVIVAEAKELGWIVSEEISGHYGRKKAVRESYDGDRALRLIRGLDKLGVEVLSVSLEKALEAREIVWE